MSFFDLIEAHYFDLNSSAFVYTIVAWQVSFGLPPIYKKLTGTFPFYQPATPNDKQINKLVLGYVFPAILIVVILFAVAELFGFDSLKIFVFIPLVWIGIRIRADLFKATNGPFWWSDNYWVIKYPMLPFDIWTIGISSFLLLMKLF